MLTNPTLELAPPVNNKIGGVAVLVVHGVNAPVPDPNFSTLQDVTNLLVNHDFRPEANYTPAAITQFSIKVDGVPAYKPDPTRPPDQGNAAMIEAIREFNGDAYFWPTQRQETTREFLDPTTGQKKSSVSVHLHELYWADLSRPKAFSIFNTFAAFLSLLFSACSLGRKSLGEAIRRIKDDAAKAGPGNLDAEKRSLELSFLNRLLLIQFLIEQLLTAVLPSVNLWVAGAGLTYYLLTLTQPVHDAVVPTILGLLSMGGYLFQFVNEKPPKPAWQFITFSAVGLGIVVCFVDFLLGSWFTPIALGSAVLAGLWITTLILGWCFGRLNMKRFWAAVILVWLTALGFLIYEFIDRICVPNLWSVHYPPVAWKSMILLWGDWICSGLSILWAALTGFTLLFLVLAAVFSLLARKYSDWDRTIRAVWTACVANTGPALILLVLTLGCWQILAWCLGVRHAPIGIPDHYLLPVHNFERFLGSAQELTRASKLWFEAARHPWIQFAFLWFIVVSLFLAIAIAPNVRLEIYGVKPVLLNGSPDQKEKRIEEADWVGKATDAFFDALGLGGSIIAKLMGILAPLLLLGVAYFHASAVKNCAIDEWARWCIRVVAVLYFLIAVVWQLRGKARPFKPKQLLFSVLNPLVTAVSVWVVTLHFFLNIVWALPLSALFVLVGVRFVFKTILDAALDVVNWLRLTPRDDNPRGQIIARFSALMNQIVDNYDTLVIVAHSQGAVIVVEYLRYLELIGAPPKIPTSLFTVGCPLRQLYSARFPDVYSWVGNTPEDAQAKLRAPACLSKWLNGYTTGDYIGRNLWSPDAKRDIPAEAPTDFEPRREEICLGTGAHIHYFDWRFDAVANELDKLIVAAAS